MTKSKSKTASSKLTAKLEWLPKKTFTLEFEIPWSKVQATYQTTLDKLAKEVKLQGFRQGKAPKKLVEKSIDKGKLYGEVINQLLPLSYAKAVADHKLRPAIAPKVQILKADENQPWQFKATACELPEIKLGDYQKIAQAALAKDKIWTPEKGSPKKDDKPSEMTDTQKFETVAKALIEEIKIDLSDLLIDSERDRLLAKLLDQVQKLGLTIDQYAQSAGKTVEQLKQDYQKTAENSLKLELILQVIADEKNLKADESEIQKMIAATGDEKIKKQLNTPQEKAYIASILRKRQAIDYLLSL